MITMQLTPDTHFKLYNKRYLNLKYYLVPPITFNTFSDSDNKLVIKVITNELFQYQ